MQGLGSEGAAEVRYACQGDSGTSQGHRQAQISFKRQDQEPDRAGSTWSKPGLPYTAGAGTWLDERRHRLEGS